MNAVKWIFVVLFGVGSAGSLAMAFTSGGATREVSPRTAPPLALRDFPAMTGALAAARAPRAPDVAKTPEPVAKAPEPVAVAPEPVEKTPEPVEKTPEPVEKTPEPVEKTPEPVAKAAAPAPKAPAPAKTPAPAAKAPEPVAKAPAPEKAPEPVAKAPEPEPTPEPAKVEPKPEPAKAAAPKAAEPVAAKAPAGDGLINLRASDTADVYLDGKKLGGSPLLGIKAKVGNHKVRFDCYDAAGNTVAGPVQTIAVKAEAELDIEYPCPVE